MSFAELVRRAWAWSCWLALASAGPAFAAAPAPEAPATVVAPGLYLSGSQGPLVVMQAGLGDDHRVWARVVADLARDHRVLTIDRPGHGPLPATHQPRDPCTQADETRQRLQDAGLAPPYLLVGHSLGGRYVAAQALRHPREAAGLVLVDATPPGHWQRVQAETPALAAMLKALRVTVFDATTRREFDDQDGCMDTLTAPAGAPHAASPAEARAAAVPTVVLTSGRRRPEETPDYAALLARGQALWPALTGAARVEVAHDAGHYIQRDAPDRVAAAVRRLSSQGNDAAPRAAAPDRAPPAATDDTLPEALRRGLGQLAPGSTTRQQARQALGEPTERQAHADAEVWVYNPRMKLPPGVAWLPVLGDVLELADLAHQRLRRHELILEFDVAGVLRRHTVRALDG